VAVEAARVLAIGGGAYYLAPLLREIIPHLEVPRHAEFANAQGELALGRQLPERLWARLRPLERLLLVPSHSVILTLLLLNKMPQAMLPLSVVDNSRPELAVDAQLW
jgi:hypothetical protein